MSSAATLPRPTIEDQRDEVAREIRQRERLYPEWVQKGRYKPETADKKIRDIRAAHASLAFLAQYAEGIRLVIKVLQRVKRFGPASDDTIISDSEAEDMLRQPAVRALVEAFPNGKVEFRRIGSQFCAAGESSDSEE
ncbi:hypothetical protein [Hyphomicrobium denitrificans]|nr:hypothetical protein [Hyphomicrobium denitrificans]